jgi:hypothetical protein
MAQDSLVLASPPPAATISVSPRKFRLHGSYLLVAGYFPVFAVVLTLIIYLGASGALAAGYAPAHLYYWARDLSALAGLLLAAMLWWLIASEYCRYTTARLANPRVYDEICNQLSQLRQLLAVCKEQQQTAEYREADEHLSYVEQYLRASDSSDVRWELATGYLDLQDRLNQAEEALILLLPPQRVIVGALNDVLSLGGSDIPDRQALMAALWHAVNTLNPSAVAYVDRLRSAEKWAANGDGDKTDPRATTQDDQTPNQVYARAALRTVRHAINEYRHARWSALVRMRNQSLSSLCLLATLLYAMVLLASVAGIPAGVLSLATVYFLVGASTGALVRLRSAAQSEFAVEDFGLANMRLATRPFTSGLAALLGIIGLSFIPLQFSGQVLTLGAMSASDLTILFSPERLGTGMLLSAIFGLAPEAVFRQFGKVAETYGKELKSSRASESAATL